MSIIAGLAKAAAGAKALNGEVVRRRREYDIQTPPNFAIYAALKPYIKGTPVPQRLATNTASP